MIGGWLLLAPAVLAAEVDLPDAFADAAAEFSVPEAVLLALSYEASRWQPDAASQWGGYGLFDLREPGEGGPDIERAARLLDTSPDDIIADPAQQVRAAAALLADTARRGGPLPGDGELLAWGGAIRSFSGRHAPNLQHLFSDYIFALLEDGVPDDGSGLAIAAHELPARERPVLLPPPPGTCDYAGCYQFVDASSSNYSDYSRTSSDIRYIIVHTVQGSYAGCISWFQNSAANVSAHYVVRSSDGQVTQMVDESDVAWHAGNWEYNLASVGIEHEGYVDAPATWYTDAMYASSGALSADIARRNSVPLSRTYIIGHNEVPGATHTDPGSGWDWDAYMDAISGGGGTGSLLGVVAAEDIYTGERLTDAVAWIEETGETAPVDADGQFRFTDLSLDTYTVTAVADGYQAGSCTKALSVGDNWCSIALLPGESDTQPGDTDDDDNDGGQDTGGLVAQDTPQHLRPPGTAVPLSELGGCTTAGALGAGWLLVLPTLLARRRLTVPSA